MITADEVGRITVFADLSAADRESLSGSRPTSAWWPASTPPTRAAAARCSPSSTGRIEAVHVGRRRGGVVGERHPGDLFGEVPIALGTVFPVGFRAAERSRVMRHRAERLPRRGLRAPGRRAGGGAAGRPSHERRGRAAGARGGHSPPRAIVVGPRWNADCAELRHFLDRNQISSVGAAGAARPPRSCGAGRCRPTSDCPMLRVIGGKTVVQPQLRRVAELLGLSTEPDRAEYDTVIVGAGPAGLAAAVYGASEGLRTIVIEREAPGGQAGTSSRIENYLGFPSGVSGDELASRALQQARRLGAEILVTRTITRIDADTRQVHLDGGDVLRARTIILACGVTWRQLSIDGLRPARRQGHLLRRLPQRGLGRPRARRAHRRGRQLGGTGGDVLLQPRPPRDHPLPRLRAGAEHVALPARPARGARQHRGADCSRGRRRLRRQLDRGDRRAQLRHRRDGARWRAAACSS